MKDVLELIKDFEGIIGALLGVIVTVVLAQLIKTFGKVRFYLIEFEVNLKGKINDYGFEEETNNLDETSYVIITSKLEIYNGSEIPKILRDIKLSYYKNKKYLFSTTIDDEETQKFSAAQIRYNQLHNINLPPKSIKVINIRGLIGSEELDLYKQCNKIFIEVKDHKGSKEKILLNKG